MAKYTATIEVEFEAEKHCNICQYRTGMNDDCALQLDGGELIGFGTISSQMENCPLKLVEESEG